LWCYELAVIERIKDLNYYNLEYGFEFYNYVGDDLDEFNLGILIYSPEDWNEVVCYLNIDWSKDINDILSIDTY
jgi:hypothetical protein